MWRRRYYGESRLTNDVDVVAHIGDAGDLQRIIGAFPFEEFYLPPIEAMRVEHARGLRGHFTIIHHDTGLKADVYLMGHDPLHAWALARRRRELLADGAFVVAPPEYVIL